MHAAVLQNSSDILGLILTHNTTHLNTRNYQGEAVKNSYPQRLLNKNADSFIQDVNGQTPLHEAARLGDTAAMNLLLNTTGKIISLNAASEAGMTPLHMAVDNNRSGAVSMLLQYEDIDVNAKDIQGRTPLYIASYYGYSHIANLLIAKNAQPDIQTKEGKTALYVAAEKGYISIVRLLLNTKYGSTTGVTPLHIAVANNQSDIVKLLLEHSEVDVLEQNDEGWTALHTAAGKGFHYVTHILLSAEKGKLNLNVKDKKDGVTPLHVAVGYKQSDIVKLLLEYEETDLNPQDNEGWTPLHMAVLNNNSDIVKLLLNIEETNIDIQDFDGMTAVHWASYIGSSNILGQLIDKNATINIPNKDGLLPLQSAVGRGTMETVRLLLNTTEGRISLNTQECSPLCYAVQSNRSELVLLLLTYNETNINQQDSEGNTLIHLAVYEGLDDILQILINKKPSTLIPNNASVTPLQMAAALGNAQAVKILLRAVDGNLPINKQSKSGFIPLHYAAKEGHTEIIQILLRTVEGKLSVNFGSRTGATPLHIAVYYNQTDVVRQLLDAEDIDIDRQDVNGWTSLFRASIEDFVHISKMLINKKAKTDISTKDGWTPLHAAAFKGHIAIVHHLLNTTEGIQHLNLATDKGLTPLHLAAKEGHKKVAKLLLNTKEGKLCLQLQTINGTSPLIVAVQYNRSQIVRLFLDYSHTNINQADFKGWTAVHWASFKGFSQVLNILIEENATSDSLRNDGSTSRHVSSNADINMQAHDGVTPLHLACQEGHIETARILIQNNASVDKLTKYRITPLYHAIYNCYEDITWLLLDNGAKVSYLWQDPLPAAKLKKQNNFVHKLLGKVDILISKTDLFIYR